MRCGVSRLWRFVFRLTRYGLVLLFVEVACVYDLSVCDGEGSLDL